MTRDRSTLDTCAGRTWCVAFLIAALADPAALRAEDELDRARSGLREKADSIRASADDLFKLGRIPWVTDPAEGFRLAAKEKRPVFLYVQAGDPLEDC